MAPAEEAKDSPPLSPLVLELQKLDDEFLKLQKAYEQEAQALRRQHSDRQKPLLGQRQKVLETSEGGSANTGTPGIPGFWLQAMKNHGGVAELIEDWDQPVLKYLRDIACVDLDPEDSRKGFRLKFHFVENPYFTNAVLAKEYHVYEESPYSGEVRVHEIRGCKISWKAGKNVTVEKTKAKGSLAKKKSQPRKEVSEPRPSFFREFFRTVKEGGRLPEDVDPHELAMSLDLDDNADEEDMVVALMDMDHGAGEAIRYNIIPFAVRWYTGEADPDQDDEDDQEEEEEEEDEEDD